jgi:hypothetical protein
VCVPLNPYAPLLHISRISQPLAHINSHISTRLLTPGVAVSHVPNRWHHNLPPAADLLLHHWRQWCAPYPAP